jgi:hypothetical protein
LLVATCPSDSFAKDSLAPFIATFEEIHARGERFALVIDTRPLKTMPSATWRKELTDWTNNPRVQRNSGRFNVGAAIILTSVLARGIYTALLWVWKPPSPQFAAATMAEAVDWCCDRLAEAGVPRSPKLIELHQSLHAPDPAVSKPHRGFGAGAPKH